MKISVVIPTYNREEHLNNCLESLLLQKKKPFEILIVDNSDDQYVKKIINNFENKFKEQDIHILSLINPINMIIPTNPPKPINMFLCCLFFSAYSGLASYSFLLFSA